MEGFLEKLCSRTKMIYKKIIYSVYVESQSLRGPCAAQCNIKFTKSNHGYVLYVLYHVRYNTTYSLDTQVELADIDMAHGVITWV